MVWYIGSKLCRFTRAARIAVKQSGHDRAMLSRSMLNKVPAVTAGTSIVMGTLFLIALGFQLTRRRYVPSIYWLVVVLVSVVGTHITDNLTDNLHVSLETTTIVFSMALAAVVTTWWLRENTLAVHEIETTPRELFYWSAICSLRNRISVTLSALIFLSAIGLTAFACFVFKINGVLAFWIAYVLKRPLGASLGDLLSQTNADGGLGMGTTLTSAVFLTVILVLVVRKQRAIPEPVQAHGLGEGA